MFHVVSCSTDIGSKLCNRNAPCSPRAEPCCLSFISRLHGSLSPCIIVSFFFLHIFIRSVMRGDHRSAAGALLVSYMVRREDIFDLMDWHTLLQPIVASPVDDHRGVLNPRKEEEDVHPSTDMYEHGFFMQSNHCLKSSEGVKLC